VVVKIAARKTELLVCKSQTGTSKKKRLKNTTGEAEKTPKRRQIDR
jgi:hypothetical protein